MTEIKKIQLDGNGIAWDGVFDTVCLTALSTNEKGRELQEHFEALVKTGEKVNFAVAFPEDGSGKQETREGAGIVTSYKDDGEEVTVLFKLDSNVKMHITKNTYR